MSKKMTIIIAVICALLGVFIIIGYIAKIEERTALDSNLVPVVFAKRHIPRYSLLSPKMVRIEMVPSKYVQPKSINTIKGLVDKNGVPNYVTIASIEGGEMILGNKLSIPGGETGLSVIVPKGQRAIVVPVNEDSLSGNLIKPGNRVDLIATFDERSVVFLQNLLILSVGGNLLGEMSRIKKGKKSLELASMLSVGSGTVTIAVTPKQALKISFAKNKCRFNIALRNALDNEIIKEPPITSKNLIGTPIKAKKVTIYEGDRIIREFFKK